MISDSSFKPAWWLRGPHLQTIWPTFMRLPVKLAIRRERVDLPDGDFLDVDWVDFDKNAPIVIVLHGLEGSINSPYSKGILKALKKSGICSAFMHFRGCSEDINRFDRSYHSGKTEDLAYLVSVIESRFPKRKIGALGYSLGGNVLLKWLGETGDKNPLKCAAAVSVPYLLNCAVDRLNKGISKIYQRHLISSQKRKFYARAKKYNSSVDLAMMKKLNTFREFDDKITAPLNDFADAQDYYYKSSSRQYLNKIQIPTLLIHAKNDPFMKPDVIPEEDELSEYVNLELSQHGGHVGFISGRIPGYSEYWLERRIPKHFLKLCQDRKG